MSSEQSGMSRRAALAGAGGVLGMAAVVTGMAGLGPLAQAAGNLNTGGVADLFGPLHHVGIALKPDFDDAQAKLSVLGVRWYQTVTETLTLRDEHGHVGTYTDRFVLSKGAEPHLELLDAVPHSFFGATRAHPVFEIGYVVGPENLTAASAMLTAVGMPRVGTIATDPQDGPVGVAWHEVERNFLIELLAVDPTLDMT